MSNKPIRPPLPLSKSPIRLDDGTAVALADMRRALEWYADYDNYDREDEDHITAADADRGEIARRALAAAGPAPEETTP